MAKQFYTRLRNYYLKVAQVLRGEADAASVFPNTTDIGVARERVYASFLRQHAPSKCNVFLGGFLFHSDGSESQQIDVIITTDTVPRFDFHNQDGGGKSFSPVEGTIGVASIKSILDKAQLLDAINGLASIPPMEPLAGRSSPIFRIPDYDDWPYKIVYASDGIAAETLLKHLADFYTENSDIPITRRPNMIHVAGKYVVVRILDGMTVAHKSGASVEQPKVGDFHLLTTDSDLQAMLWALDALQQKASAASHILFEYRAIINRIHSTA